MFHVELVTIKQAHVYGPCLYSIRCMFLFGLVGLRQWILTDENQVHLSGKNCPTLTLIKPTVQEGHLCLDVEGKPTLRVPLNVSTEQPIVNAT